MGERVFRPRGDLDVATVDRTLDQWLGIIDAERPCAVTVDLSEVDFLDSSGLWMLCLLRRCLTDRDIEFRLRGASPHQQVVFEVAGVGGLFPDAAQPLEPPPRFQRR